MIGIDMPAGCETPIADELASLAVSALTSSSAEPAFLEIQRLLSRVQDSIRLSIQSVPQGDIAAMDAKRLDSLLHAYVALGDCAEIWLALDAALCVRQRVRRGLPLQ